MAGDAPFLGNAFSDFAISEVDHVSPDPYGVHNQNHVYRKLAVLVCLLPGIAWAPPAPQQAVVTPTELWFPKWQEPPRAAPRSVDLLYDFSQGPRVPDVEYVQGWQSRFSDPPKGHALRYENLGDTTILGPKVSDTQYQDGWRSKWQEPVPRLPRSVDLLGRSVNWGPRVPDAEFQDGWRSRFSDPPVFEQARRSVELLGDIKPDGPRTPDAEYQDGWRQEFSKPQRLTHQPRLEGQVSWPGFGYNFVQAATPSEFWFPRWGEPPKALPRSVDLLSSIAWDPQFRAAVGTPSELWFPRWNDPPKSAPRSLDLLSGIEWPNRTPEVEYQDGWRSRFTDPPKLAPRSVDLLGRPVWAARVADVQFQDGWRSQFSEPPQYLEAKPRLEGQVSWGPRTPDTEFQDGWRNKWQDPPAHLQARRSVDLLYGWSYQALNTAANVVSVTTEMWHNRWPDFAPKAHALRYENLGDTTILAPRVADRQFQDGWRNKWQDPPAYLDAQRSVDLLCGWDWLPRVADRQFQDGWRSQFSEPPAYLRAKPRLPGSIAWDPQVIAQAAFNNFEAAWTFKWPNPPPPLRSVASTGIPVWPGIGFATPPNLVCAFLPVQDPNWTIEVGFSVAPPVLTLGAFDVPVDDSTFELLVASYSFDLPVGCRQGCNCPNCNC